MCSSDLKAAHIIKKVLDSAIANAEHNEGADVDELTVSTIHVDEGMTMKRLRPRAKGRADRILKRTCHITVKVADSESEIIVESFNTNRTNNGLSHVTAKSVIARKNIRGLHRLPITGPGTKVG